MNWNKLSKTGVVLSAWVAFCGCGRTASPMKSDGSSGDSAVKDGALDGPTDIAEGRRDGEASDQDRGDGANDVGAESIGDAGGCSGTIQFRLEAVDATGWLAVDSGEDCGDWLSIFDFSGQEVAIGHPAKHCCQLIGCGVCHPEVICPAAFSDYSLPITRTWDTTIYRSGVCGARSAACVQETPSCAPSASYVVRMCGKRDNTSPWTCVKVPFTIPGSSLIVGTLPSIGDAGANGGATEDASADIQGQ